MPPEPNTPQAAPPADEILCPHCVQPIGPFDHFCPHCNEQVTAHAAIDPLGQVFAQGNAFRHATSDARPKLIVVLGMWLIFGPSLLLMTLGLLLWSSNVLLPGLEDDSFTSGSIGIALRIGSALLAVALCVLYIAILWQTTRRYIRAGREQSADEPDDHADGE